MEPTHRYETLFGVTKILRSLSLLAFAATAACSSTTTATTAGAPLESPDASDGGPTSSPDASPAVIGECFGRPAAGQDAGPIALCAFSRCCGAFESCAKDSLCTQVVNCSQACTTQSCQQACVAPLQDMSNIASEVWFDDYAGCMNNECLSGHDQAPKMADDCSKYSTCGSCVAAVGTDGNCGWLSDGTCHAGSTAGPDDPSVWGSSGWTFFDPAGCPGSPTPKGCTADSDCSGCARCDRGTGSCVSCPVGSAGVCTC
jgi:hypothetical protein